MSLTFEWDPEKARANLRKHDVGFEEAASSFADPLSLTIPDPAATAGERRYALLGHSDQKRLLVVLHAEHGDTIRLISARLATRAERKSYEEGS